jgi:hypothetical protein
MQKPNGPVELPFFDFWISIAELTRQKLLIQYLSLIIVMRLLHYEVMPDIQAFFAHYQGFSHPFFILRQDLQD